MSGSADKNSDWHIEARTRFNPHVQASGKRAQEVRPPPRTRSQTAPATREDVEKLVPSASHLMAQAAIAEAERMMEMMRQKALLSAEIKALIGHLGKPAFASDDLVALTLVGGVIRRAASNNLREINLHRFQFPLAVDPQALRCVNAQNWSALPPAVQKMHQLWKQHLSPLGYVFYIKAVENAADAPCEFELILSWQ